MAISRDDIFGRVREVLVDALGVDDDEIAETATLQGDLNAESIDFLDIVFRLEKEFEIKIPRGEMFPVDVLSNPDFVESGKLTNTGLSTLKSTMPHVDFTGFEDNPKVDDIPNLFTVRTIINYVETKLAVKSAATA